MAEENKTQGGSGLRISKKTIISVTALLLGIMLFAGILTQVVQPGEYLKDEAGQYILDAEGEAIYQPVESDYKFWRVIISPVEAFVKDFSSASTGLAVVAFIILIGGTFLVLDKSGVLKYIMVTVVDRYQSKKYKLLALIVLICMAMSSFVGILEESLTLVPLAVAISLALGWDSMVGLCMSLVSIAFGYAAATFNPFNVVIVQSMSEDMPLFSGTLYRVLVFAVTYGVFIALLLPYAKKVERNPQRSLAYQSDLELRERFLGEDSGVKGNKALGKATKTFVLSISGVLVVTVLTFVLRSFIKNEAIADYISYLPMVAMALLFTIGGLRAGSIAGIKGKALGASFWEGAKTIMPCLPMVLFILCITYILKAGKVIDTLLYYVYSWIGDFNSYAALAIIFLFILVLEFFIGSGTAKAFLIMPLLLPLTSMCNISHQSLTLAFCLSDGLGNILFPTSSIMLIAIGLINVSYFKYMRFMWKFFLAEFAAAIGLVMLSVAIGY